MHRLFVAIRPPEEVRERLLDVMAGVPNLRWQEDAQLHLTLRFIGEVERPTADDLVAALERVRYERFSIALDGIGRFQQHRRGALWTGVQPKEQLKALAAKIERACQSAGLEPERRAFHPHITLSRWKGTPNLGAFLELHANLTSDPWEVREFILYESRLGQSGAHYEAVASYPLS